MISNAPEPVLGLGQERDRRLQNAAKMGLACSTASVVMTIIAVVLDVAMGNRALQPRRIPQNDVLPPLLALPIIFSLAFMLFGIGLGIYTRRLRTGRVAIVVGLSPLAVYAFLSIIGVIFIGATIGHVDH